MGFDHVLLIGRPGLHEFRADFGRDGTRRRQVLGTGEFGSLAKTAVQTERHQFVVHAADGGAGGKPGRGIALAAFGCHPHLGERTLLAHLRGREVHEFFGLARGGRHRCNVAIALDPKSGHGLAGLRDAIHDRFRPMGFDADHDAGGHVGVRAGADHGAKVQFQILTELQAPVGMRQCNGALDMGRHRFAGSVRNIVQRKDGDIVADADAAVFTAIAPDGAI